MEVRGAFGLTGSDVILEIFGDDGKSTVAFLGANAEASDEMMFVLLSKSKTDKREVRLSIGENGGAFDSWNKMGENVIRLAIGNDGSGGLDVRDKFGYKR